MSSVEEIIGDVIQAPSVFKNKSILYPEYLPDRLPHREKQLKMLAQVFKPLLASPGETSQRVVLAGSYGTGKTATSRLFGKTFSLIAKNHGLNVKYVHVNCYKARTLPQVIHSIASGLEIFVPPRGLSVREMLKGILDELERKKQYAIVALDEFDYFTAANAGTPAIYTIIRLYDDDMNRKKRMHFIFIVRSPQVLDALEPAISTFFLRNTIHFTPYTTKEIYDILGDRVPQAFFEGAVDDEVIKYISILEGADAEGAGSARTALEILVRAGESADSSGRSMVTIDDVRKAHVVVKPELAMLQDTIETLSPHELIVLLAIVKTLKESSSPFVRIGEVEKTYKMLCENYGERQRRHTQVYTYIMGMRSMRIVQTKSSGKGYRGKSTLIGISNAPLDILERRIEEILTKKLV
uniref:ORC1-type DNA replication protein n=1 Tax=Fervidicoccus fontis TaxID=683846 RepID=A0A7J3ZLU1_9CREN